MTNAEFDRLLCGAAAQLREERMAEYRAAQLRGERLAKHQAAQLREERPEKYQTAQPQEKTPIPYRQEPQAVRAAAPRPRRRAGGFGLLWAAVLLCAFSATAFAAKPLFFYRLAFPSADWTEITLAVSDAAADVCSAQNPPHFCSISWVPPVFSECSRTPIEGEAGVYDLTMRRGDKVLSVYQAPCDAFVLFGSTGAVDAVREELEGMTEIPTRKGWLYFGASEDGRLTALLLREGTAIFVSGNIDQRSFLKFVQNIDL